MSQLTCLSFCNPAGHLGEINVDVDMQMEELLFQLSVQMGMQLPLKLVHDTTVLVFAPADSVRSALSSAVPNDCLESPKIHLEIVSLDHTELDCCCCGNCKPWWFDQGWCCPESSYKRDGADQLCLLKPWLLAACRAGQISTVKACLENSNCDINGFMKVAEQESRRGGPPNMMWTRFVTCLNEAVAAGQAELCKWLIAKKANVNKGAVEEADGYYHRTRKETVLYAALQGGHVNICQILIDSKAQLEYCWDTSDRRFGAWERTENRGSAVSVAVQQNAGVELCRLLLDARADPLLGEVRRVSDRKGPGKGYGKQSDCARESDLEQMLRKGFGKGHSAGQCLNDDGIMETWIPDIIWEWITEHKSPLQFAARRNQDAEQFKVMLAPADNDGETREQIQ
eukprot:TRINITY_DN26896_c0_g1_i1.p1 TRINITY_DN26896_c0_g1~~TRINITY_DN26896_c0_g1_i1.p1  ORF type:complete len:398 (-),score=67.41 TRINITY_DN26896_c0_g1_i1:6-1199(-)